MLLLVAERDWNLCQLIFHKDFDLICEEHYFAGRSYVNFADVKIN